MWRSTFHPSLPLEGDVTETAADPGVTEIRTRTQQRTGRGDINGTVFYHGPAVFLEFVF